MSLERFDESIDAVQRAQMVAINEGQQEAFWKTYHFRPVFEYGRDEKGRYILRATKDMMKQLEYYAALKFDRPDLELFIEGHIAGQTLLSVSYRSSSLHLEELFQFLEKHR